jgi:oxalate decarboxylase
VVRKNLGHYVENTGSAVLQFLEVFRTSKYEEVSLAEWPGHLPPELVMQHFNLNRQDLGKFPRNSRGIVELHNARLEQSNRWPPRSPDTGRPKGPFLCF